MSMPDSSAAMVVLSGILEKPGGGQINPASIKTRFNPIIVFGGMWVRNSYRHAVQVNRFPTIFSFLHGPEPEPGGNRAESLADRFAYPWVIPNLSLGIVIFVDTRNIGCNIRHAILKLQFQIIAGHGASGAHQALAGLDVRTDGGIAVIAVNIDEIIGFSLQRRQHIPAPSPAHFKLHRIGQEAHIALEHLIGLTAFEGGCLFAIIRVRIHLQVHERLPSVDTGDPAVAPEVELDRFAPGQCRCAGPRSDLEDTDIVGGQRPAKTPYGAHHVNHANWIGGAAERSFEVGAILKGLIHGAFRVRGGRWVVEFKPACPYRLFRLPGAPGDHFVERLLD
jgi:hypothetical protein